MAQVVTIKHKITTRSVTTTVTLPGEAPISKRWVRCDDGMVGEFELDWDEDPRLAGWSEVAEAAMRLPDTL